MGEVKGFEKMEHLLADPDISEIMINGPQKVFIEKKGIKTLTDVSFSSDDEVMKFVSGIFEARGKRVDQDIPYGDVCLKDGTRVNAIIPPASRFGVTVTIRKFSDDIQTTDDLLRLGTLNEKALAFLIACVKGRINMLFSGGTGVGKTTALQALSHYFGAQERVIVIEDAAELKLQQENIVSLETKTPDRDGRGGVSLRDLIRNALRMAPDRLVVGEIRGVESLDMIQAMATGHSGTIGIVHGNSPREVVSRLETMILMSGVNLPIMDVRKLIASTVQVIVHLERVPDGSRKVTHITEIRGLDHEQIFFNDLFQYSFDKKDAQGKDIWGLMPVMRNYPLFFKQLDQAGLVTLKIFSREM